MTLKKYNPMKSIIVNIILPNFSREIEQHCASPLGAIYNPANGSGHRDLFFRYCFIDNTNYIFSIFH